MYRFNAIEKHIISELVSLKGRQVMLGNLIIKKVNRALIQVNPTENSATMILHHYMGSVDENMKLYEKVYQENMELLCTAVGLLKYLKRSHLIYDYSAVQESELRKQYTLGFHCKPEIGGVKWVIEDNDLVKNIIEFSHRIFIPTSDLKDIVANGYKTNDEVRFKKQMIATWASIAIAFSVGLYGVFKGDCVCQNEDITMGSTGLPKAAPLRSATFGSP